ncbi:MAG: hypothetical protein WKG01_30855 [Kofleriaceae bacterium]
MRYLEFTRDGSRLVVRSATGLSVLDLRGTAPPIPIAATVHAFATVADQLWVVAGSPAILTAYDLTCNAIASIPISEPGATPRFLRSPAAKLASFLGTEVSTIAFDRTLAATTLASDIDLALPLSSTRTIVASRQRLSLRDQDSARWTISLAQLGTISDAAVVLDGKAVAVTASTPTSQAIIVVGLRDGAILHRIVVGMADGVSYAPARGVALVHTHDSRLVLVDLRFGRVIVNYAEQRAVVDAAIDDAGRDIALRLADQDAVVHVTVANLLAAAAASPPPSLEPTAPEAPAEEAPVAMTAPTNGAAAVVVDPFTAGGLALSGTALPPRPERELTTITGSATVMPAIVISRSRSSASRSPGHGTRAASPTHRHTACPSTARSAVSPPASAGSRWTSSSPRRVGSRMQPAPRSKPAALLPRGSRRSMPSARSSACHRSRATCCC